MSWELSFHSKALKEFHKLDNSIKAQFRIRLERLMAHAAGPDSELGGELSGWQKIKLRKHGYRLVYFRDPAQRVIRVIAVGRRDEGVYQNAIIRLDREI